MVAPTGAVAEVQYAQGVPPVVNDATSVGLLRAGTQSALGPDAATTPSRAWAARTSPGISTRCRARWPGSASAARPPQGRTLDLHQPTFDIDEDAIAVGVRLLVHTVLTVLG